MWQLAFCLNEGHFIFVCHGLLITSFFYSCPTSWTKSRGRSTQSRKLFQYLNGLLNWIFLAASFTSFAQVSITPLKAIWAFNPYVLLWLFSATMGYLWVLIWPWLLILGDKSYFDTYFGKILWIFSKTQQYTLGKLTTLLLCSWLKAATTLNRCKNVSDKYFFHFCGINLLINLSPDQNY